MKRLIAILATAAALTGAAALAAPAANAATVHPGHSVTVSDRPGSKVAVTNRDHRSHVVKVTVRCTAGPWRGWTGTGTVRVAAHATQVTTILDCPNTVTRARVTR